MTVSCDQSSVWTWNKICFPFQNLLVFAFARVYNDIFNDLCVKVRGMRQDSILEFEKIESFRSTVLFTSLFYISAQFY